MGNTFPPEGSFQRDGELFHENYWLRAERQQPSVPRSLPNKTTASCARFYSARSSLCRLNPNEPHCTWRHEHVTCAIRMHAHMLEATSTLPSVVFFPFAPPRFMIATEEGLASETSTCNWLVKDGGKGWKRCWTTSLWCRCRFGILYSIVCARKLLLLKNRNSVQL